MIISSKKNSPEHYKEYRLTAISLAVTIFACILLAWDMLSILVERIAQGNYTGGLIQVCFIGIILFLLAGSFVYHLTRLGRLKRLQSHCPLTRDRLESLYEGKAPSLAILVPSYKEDPKVITRTLLSAALLDYPAKQVILLIDNPAEPDSPADRELLLQTQALPKTIKAMLDGPSSRLRDANNRFIKRSASGNIDSCAEYTKLSALYNEAAVWLKGFASDYPADNHEDRWFIQEILCRPAQDFENRSAELANLALNTSADVSTRRLHREYTRLSRLFQVEISSFERKCYVNLSHEPNKAMNLNSYLGLMGHYIAEQECPDGLHLAFTDETASGRHIPDADYVITLDADSLLMNDYALRLVSVAEQPGNEQLAVVQTPYSAFYDAPSEIERIAGATTDIQYLIHQGFSNFNATFWVGANALIRKRALQDIASEVAERGHTILKFIQDRTVIEDTESSVDLVGNGWRLYNYPERLAYSATPPDFGSLLIQRRRWANGGLIILPKFIRYITSQGYIPCRLTHGFLGGHYLTSLAGVNLGFMALLMWPFDEAMRTLWLPLATLPYFMLYTRDLTETGYNYSDVFRVYALNLLLVPVNLGGVFKSLQQIITGKRTAFSRTPKVAGRTAIPLLYLIAVYGCMLYCLISLTADLHAGRTAHAIFAAVNASILWYAISKFIGFRETLQDMKLTMTHRDPDPATKETYSTNSLVHLVEAERKAS
jgi:cellulose synthase/poly-beta-1,6-N-acetylglucosamine synthase-like glycosyltransferase